MVLMYQDTTSSTLKTKELIPLLILSLTKDPMPSTCMLTAAFNVTQVVFLMTLAAQNCPITMLLLMLVTIKSKAIGFCVTLGLHLGEKMDISELLWDKTFAILNILPGFHLLEKYVSMFFNLYQELTSNLLENTHLFHTFSTHQSMHTNQSFFHTGYAFKRSQKRK